ncbi:MAG: type I DNA topoisomerase [Propionibacteriaceae bacterium]|nr:type I DNA topoisomerase [Propionibacteriaceae bacterium]
MAEKRNKLVIVESPTKATKIASYLGAGYTVESSRGHVRDLPTTASEIPAKYKGEPWARTGVDVDADFKPLYVVPADKKSTITQLKKHMAAADELYLATDEDREGEAIAWHLLEELKPKVPVKRMVFHEITPQAIAAAVASPRELDLDLVDAQETRRILDRLYGYEVSPVLWRKVMPRLSAGRVQSVATRLIVDKEKERMAFRSASYWDVSADLDAGAAADPRVFTARLTTVGKAKIAQGRDFSATGELKSKALALNEVSAQAVAAALRNGTHTVSSVEARPYTRRPYAPFRTTTLQQEAGRKLGFTAQRTMSVAQDLYEGGYITYMRTDSVTLSGQAITAARAQIRDLYGEKYVPDKPRQYTSKVKNAQEAHEAIRPAGEFFRTPASSGLVGDQFRLYELVWQRTLASQMADAVGEQVTITINAATDLTLDDTRIDSCTLVASGRTVTFPGFLKAYVESSDDPDAQSDDQQARLPNLKQGAPLTPQEVTAAGHETKPPARYTEPSLVSKLEELEIGRPSTYASIIRTITARDYVFKRGSALVPTWLAFAVTRLLEEQFPELVDYTFTATMEADLDDIARGAAKRLDVLKQFYFGSTGHEGLHKLVTELGDIDPRKLSTFELPGDDGIAVRVGKYGPYIEDPLGRRLTLAPDMAPDELTEEVARGLLDAGGAEERELGSASDNGNRIIAKDGRYGPYVTEVLPEDSPKSLKPRTGSLWKSMSLDTVTLEQAEMLLSLPRVVGLLDGEQVTAQNGRYGPYVKRGTVSRSLPTEDSILTVTLDEAQALFAAAQVRGGSRSSGPLKELGPDPATGKTMLVKDGRFGPYVTDGEINATLKRTDSPDALTPERAAELLAEKRAKPPTAKKTVRRTTSRTAAKATAAKKK